jgi:hypothetical protein
VPHDPPDLRDMDESDQHREVYAWAGLALYYAQVLEEGVLALIFAVRATDGTLRRDFETADDFFEAHASRTLGQLLRDMRQHVDLPAGIEHDTRDALAKRNFLVHHFFKDRIELAFTVAGRQQVIHELHEAVELFVHADEQLTELMFIHSQYIGLTPEAVEREFAEWRSRAAAWQPES